MHERLEFEAHIGSRQRKHIERVHAERRKQATTGEHSSAEVVGAHDPQSNPEHG